MSAGITVLRIELQAKTRLAVRSIFGDNPSTPVEKVSLERAWRALYGFAIQIRLAGTTQTHADKAALIALCERNGIRLPRGEGVLDWCLRNLKPDSAKRLRRKVADVRFEDEPIAFRDLLSENGPRTFIDIDDEGNESGAVAI